MKKLLIVIISVFTMILAPTVTSAQGMMDNLGSSSSSITVDDHTAREEAEGKEIWAKLQNKEISCGGLSDEDFGGLGEYFMGQMVGDSHKQMNQMMTQMMGEEGEKQMHVAMGKRLSGCDTSAQLPQNGVGFMPMMWMMGGGQHPLFKQTGSPMMWNWRGGFGLWLANLTLIVWLVVGILAAIWLFKQVNKK